MFSAVQLPRVSISYLDNTLVLPTTGVSVEALDPASSSAKHFPERAPGIYFRQLYFSTDCNS